LCGLLTGPVRPSWIVLVACEPVACVAKRALGCGKLFGRGGWWRWGLERRRRNLKGIRSRGWRRWCGRLRVHAVACGIKRSVEACNLLPRAHGVLPVRLGSGLRLGQLLLKRGDLRVQVRLCRGERRARRLLG
jgi:hypothetical protein